jgi:hypothetical protein
MVAGITPTQSALNFFMNQILICYCHSQISKLCHIFQGPISYLYIMILPCILVMRHQYRTEDDERLFRKHTVRRRGDKKGACYHVIKKSNTGQVFSNHTLGQKVM